MIATSFNGLAYWIAIVTLVLTTTTYAVEPETLAPEFERKEFAAKVLADLSDALNQPGNEDGRLVLKAFVVLKGHREHKELARIVDQSARPDSNLGEIGKLFHMTLPKFLSLDSPPSRFGFASETMRQCYRLRGLAAEAARQRDWADTQALYAMSSAGLGKNADVHNDNYVLSLMALVDVDVHLPVPEFEIGYRLAIANKHAVWAGFQEQLEDYPEVFARAGWAAGRSDQGKGDEARIALEEALAVLEGVPARSVVFSSPFDAFAKTNSTLTIARLLSPETNRQLLDQCEMTIQDLLPRNDPGVQAECHAALAPLRQAHGDPNAAARHIARAELLGRSLDLFATNVIACRVAEVDALSGQMEGALKGIEPIRTEKWPSVHIAVCRTLSTVAEGCAQRGMSWEETEALIKPRSDVESVWSRLGWLQGN